MSGCYEIAAAFLMHGGEAVEMLNEIKEDEYYTKKLALEILKKRLSEYKDRIRR